MKTIELEYSDCPNSEYQINKLREQCNKYKESLQRIKNTYDNVEDLAGVIAKEALTQ